MWVPWGSLTVSGQVEDKDGHEGNEDAGCDNIDDIEEWFALDDEVEGDVLVLTALRGVVRVDVLAGWAVDDFPFSIFCRGTWDRTWNGGPPPCPSSPTPPALVFLAWVWVAPNLVGRVPGCQSPGYLGVSMAGSPNARVPLSPVQGVPLPQDLAESTSVTCEAFRVDDDPFHRVIPARLWVIVCLQVHADFQGTVCQRAGRQPGGTGSEGLHLLLGTHRPPTLTSIMTDSGH